MKNISLNGAWQGVCIMPDGERFSMSASVPGSSINDLIHAGMLPGDIFYRDNAEKVQDFERCDYEYTCEFDFEPSKEETYVLRFARLDTYCDVYLNDTLLGSCENEHIPHEWNVSAHLNKGLNTVRVYFRSPITTVDDLPRRNGAFTTERMNTRRTQCTYGWDWVARFISCGINGDVSIACISENEMLLDSAYVYTKNIDEDSAGIGIDLEFNTRLPGRIVTVRIKSPAGDIVHTVKRYVAEPFVRIALDIPAPELWYPLGYGKQPVYTLEVLDGETLVRSEPFGIRTVKIMQLPDMPGTPEYEKCLSIKNPYYDLNEEFSGFILKVNGVKILCKGANWVPSEPFRHGDTSEKITRTLELSAAAGLNMLRIWGGGTFESSHFYDECTRLGIMVTQDFLMACGQYPEDEDWFIAELRKEAEFAARHIRNKACLMWWSGDNENAVNGCDTDENYMGRRSAMQGIGPVLYRLDPYRDFLPSSPYGGKKYASNTVGTTHNTQYLGDSIFPYMLSGSCADYKETWKNFRARFIAEEPQLGAISEGSIRRFMTEEDIYGENNAMWLYHTKSNPALRDEIFDISAKFAESILGRFADGKDRFFKLRYLQYEWVRITLEQLRREMWFQSGLIYWMINDCWPASSGWSIIDYYNKPKDAYYAFKRCAKQVVLSIDKEDGEYRLHVSNQGAAVPGAKVRLSVANANSVTEIFSADYDIPAAGTNIIRNSAVTLENGEFLVAEISSAANCDRTFYREGMLDIVPADVKMTRDAENRTVTVKAVSYIHAVELEGDAVFEDNCFSLMPGEERTVSYQPITEGDITVTAYTFPS